MILTQNILYLFSITFSIILLSGFVPESFSDSELKTVMIFVEPPADNEIPIQENKKDDNEKPRPAPMLPQELPSAFVTGNNYALNSESILISSEEGIALNNLLIEQINEWKTDAEHNDNFWSRTDQMIMGNFGVVNALQNPLTENKFFINGQLHSENVTCSDFQNPENNCL